MLQRSTAAATSRLAPPTASSFRQGKDARDVDLALVNESARNVLGHALDLDEETVRSALDPVAFVSTHAVPGGPAPAVVRDAIARAREELDMHEREIEARRAALARARDDLARRVSSRTARSA